jgi:Thioesterase-like superfamily
LASTAAATPDVPSLCDDDRLCKEPAHFTLTEGGAFMPSPFAQSHWGDDQLNGPAVVGLAARALENHCGSPDFMPARFTADLFRAARKAPTAIEVRVVRDGRRVRSAECDVVQDGRAFGSGMVTAVANPAAQIDFSSESIPLKGLNYE